MSNAIEVAHLHKSYRDIKAVRDLSFQVAQGTCFSILGPNGAGKTTVAKTIYAKARADKNPETVMSVFGFDPRARELAVKALIGVVPQNNNLDSELNVEQNLRIYARFYGFFGKVAGRRIDELLEFMELRERRGARVRELSGGMQRRLVIARALLNRPRLLILDEPTTGLDLQVRQLIWDRLSELRGGGVTLLLTTHYMEEALHLSDTIMIMHKGQEVLQGSVKTLLEKEIEPLVLVVSGLAGGDKGSGSAAIPGVRGQRIGAHSRFYGDSDALLGKQLKALQAATGSGGGINEYAIRKTTLDDVFMKATGGTLSDQQ